MNIQVDTLELSNDLEKAGIQREHTEAIAKVQARTVRDLVEHELVTKDFLRSELAILKAELRDEMRKEIGDVKLELGKEIGNVKLELRQEMQALMIQIRALQFGGAIAAFSVAAIVLISRLIR